MIKILTAAMMIATMPIALTSVSYRGDVRGQYLHLLEAGQFNELMELVGTVNPSDIPEIGVTENFRGYYMGSQLSKFLSYAGYDTVAYETFQRFIGLATTNGDLDSALMVAKSFAQTYPKYELPEKILKILKAEMLKKGDQAKNS